MSRPSRARPWCLAAPSDSTRRGGPFPRRHAAARAIAGRNSEDYIPDERATAKERAFQNIYNAVFTRDLGYPDYDMFQTHDVLGEYHAILRATSGGPVYLTDEPGREVPTIVRALRFRDGHVPVFDEPSRPPERLLMRDPSIEPIAALQGGRISRPG